MTCPPPDDCQQGDGDAVVRIGVEGTQETIQVKPALADKAVVIRPETPFFVMPDEKITMYVATPLWFQLFRGKSSTKIYDQPVYQPSLTWFGPLTADGELCFASRVSGRLEYDELVFRPNRAYTAIRLKNESPESVLIERFKLPVQHLSLYRNEDNILWTQGVTLEIQGAAAPSALKLAAAAPEAAGPVKPVAQARQKAGKNILNKAMGFLIN